MSRKNKKNPYHNPQKASSRRTFQHILSFLLAIVVFVMGASTTALFGFFNNRAIKQSFQNTSYYNGIQDTVIKQCKYLSIPCDIDKELFSEVFTPQIISEDVKGYISATLSGEKYDFNFTDIEKALKSEVTSNIKSKGFKIDSEMEDKIDGFCSNVLQRYKLALTIPFAGYFFTAKSGLNAVIAVLAIFAFLVIIGTVFIMLAIYRFKVVHKTFRMLAYSFISGGFMLLASALYFHLSGFVQDINIRPIYLYNAIQDYVGFGLSFAYFVSITLVILGAIFAVSSEVLRERVKHNYFLRLEDNFRERINKEIESDAVDVDSRMKGVNAYRSRVEHDEFNKFAEEQLANVKLDTNIDYDIGVKPRNRRLNRNADTSADSDFTEINPDDFK